MKYCLSVGTNIGDRKRNLFDAINYLRNHLVEIIEISSVYETSPCDYLKQDNFFNLMLLVRSDLSPENLLILVKNIEKKMGRNLNGPIPKGPRIIDIDIILWSEGQYREKHLEIPHKSYLSRMFVLKPLLELLETTNSFTNYKKTIENQIEQEYLFKDQKIRYCGHLDPQPTYQ